MAATAERRYEPEGERALRASNAAHNEAAPLRPVGEATVPTGGGSDCDVTAARGWNVLAEELVAYPPRAKRLWLEPRVSAGEVGGQGISRAYADAWLERELAALRARRASALLPDRPRPVQPGADLLAEPPRRPGTGQSVRGGSQRSLQPRHARLAEPARRLSDGPCAQSLGRLATAPRTALSGARSRGLRRLLPGAATLAVLAASWFAVGALAASANAVHVVRLPGSTAVRGGFVYMAKPGDTLWSIALRAEPGADPRPLVDRLEAELGGSTLQPGDRLFIPA